MTAQINNEELSSKSQDDVVALLRALPVGATIRMRISRQPEAEPPAAAGQASSGSSELAGAEAGAGASERSAETSPLTISTSTSAAAPTLVLEQLQSPVRSAREAVSPVSPRQAQAADPQFREFTIELPLGDWSPASATAQTSNLVGVNVHGRKKNVPADGALQPNAHAARQEDAGIFIKSISESGAAYRVF